MIQLSIVVAIDDQGGIGKSGQLAWHIPGDLKHFKKVTSQTSAPDKKNVVIMGRKTWDSLPEKFRPLPGRINGVLTRNDKIVFSAGVLVAKSLSEIITKLENSPQKDLVESVFIIGGGEIYRETLQNPQLSKLYITHVQGDYHCDTFFKPNWQNWQKISSSPIQKEEAISYHFAEYIRK